MVENGSIVSMREALAQCELFLGNVSRHAHPTLNPGDKCIACGGADELRGMVVAAIATPTRNCDVGTAQEQYDRWKDFCTSNWSAANAAAGLDPCEDCPFVDCDANGNSFGCQFAWGQMPFNVEESNLPGSR